MRNTQKKVLKTLVVVLICLTMLLVILTGCAGKNSNDESGFTIKYLDYNGNEITTQSIKAGELATAPSVNEVQGYDIVWLTEGGNVFDFNYEIQKDWTLKATLVAKQYDLTITSSNSVVTVLNAENEVLTEKVKYGETITVKVSPDTKSNNLSVTINNQVQTLTNGELEKQIVVAGEVIIVATADNIRYNLSISTDENLDISVLDGETNEYATGDKILMGKALTISATPKTGYLLQSVSGTMGTTSLVFIDGVCEIEELSGDLTITGVSVRETVITGKLTVIGVAFDKSKVTAVKEGESIAITCDENGNYSIAGIVNDGNEILVGYENFYPMVIDISEETDFEIANQNVTLEYGIVENYSNSLGYNYGTIGDTTKSFILGWAHNARLKNTYIDLTDNKDFVFTSVLTKLDYAEMWGGISLDVYDANGALARNIIMGYHPGAVASYTQNKGIYINNIHDGKLDGVNEKAFVLDMDLGYATPNGTEETYITYTLARYNGDYYLMIGNGGAYGTIIKLEASEFFFRENEAKIGFGVFAMDQQYAYYDNTTFLSGESATTFATNNIVGKTMVTEKSFTASFDNTTSGTITSATTQSGWQGQGQVVFTWTLEEGYVLDKVKVNGEEVSVSENSITINITTSHLAENTVVIYTKDISYAPLTITTNGNVTVTVEDAAQNVYTNGQNIEEGIELTVTIEVSTGYVLSAVSVKVNGASVTVTDNTATIASVSTSVVIEITTEEETKVSGNVSVLGTTFDKTKLSATCNQKTLDIEVQENGDYTISGLLSTENQIVFSYTGYYSETLDLTQESSKTITGKNVAINYVLMEHYTNSLGYWDGSTTDLPKSYGLGWAHSARAKGISVDLTDTKDFVFTSVLTKLDYAVMWGGLSLDVYDASGSLTRNIIMGYHPGAVGSYTQNKGIYINNFHDGKLDGVNEKAFVLDMDLGYGTPDGTAETYITYILARYNGDYYLMIGNGGTYGTIIKLEASLFAFRQNEAKIGFGVFILDQQYGFYDNATFLSGDSATTFATNNIVGKTMVTEKSFTASFDDATSGTITSATTQSGWQGQGQVVFTWTLEEGYILDKVKVNGEEVSASENSITINIAATHLAENTVVVYTKEISYAPLTITTDANGTVVVKDAAQNAYTSGQEIEEGTAITITVSTSSNYIVKTFSVKVNGADVTFSGNSVDITSVVGSVVVVVETEIETTVAGKVSVVGVGFDKTKISAKAGTRDLSITADDNGNYTISGLKSAEDEIIVKYVGFNDYTLDISSEISNTITGKDFSFEYAQMEVYKNILGYRTNDAAEGTLLNETFNIGYYQAARFKDNRLTVGSTDDFFVKTVVYKISANDNQMGFEFDVYDETGNNIGAYMILFKNSDGQFTICKQTPSWQAMYSAFLGASLVQPSESDATAWNMGFLRYNGDYYFAIGSVGENNFKVCYKLKDIAFDFNGTNASVGFGVYSESSAIIKQCQYYVGTQAKTYIESNIIGTTMVAYKNILGNMTNAYCTAGYEINSKALDIGQYQAVKFKDKSLAVSSTDDFFVTTVVNKLNGNGDQIGFELDIYNDNAELSGAYMFLYNNDNKGLTIGKQTTGWNPLTTKTLSVALNRPDFADANAWIIALVRYDGEYYFGIGSASDGEFDEFVKIEGVEFSGTDTTLGFAFYSESLTILKDCKCLLGADATSYAQGVNSTLFD